jgi:hypothetical protein
VKLINVYDDSIETIRDVCGCSQIPNKDIFGYYGTVAQLVEQRTENPCVTGSIPVGTTKKNVLPLEKG